MNALPILGLGGVAGALFLSAILKAVRTRQFGAILDVNGEIMRRIGLQITPAAMKLEYGVVRQIHAASSAKQVMALIPTTASIVGEETRTPSRVSAQESALSGTSRG